MANGNVTWGSAPTTSKIVHIAAVMTAGIGLVVGVGLGAEYLFEGASTGASGFLLKAGTAITGLATGITSGIATFFEPAYGAVAGLFTGSEYTLDGQDNMGEVDNNVAADRPTEAEAQKEFDNELNTDVKGAATEADKIADAMLAKEGAMQETVADLEKVIAENPSMKGELQPLLDQANDLLAKFEAMQDVKPEDLLKNANELFKSADAFNHNAAQLTELQGDIKVELAELDKVDTSTLNDAQVKALEAKVEGYEKQITAIDSIMDNSNIEKAIDGARDIHSEVEGVYDPIKLESAPKAWAIAGGGAAAGLLAHGQGWRDRILAERNAVASMQAQRG